jgi:hypothetical protein
MSPHTLKGTSISSREKVGRADQSVLKVSPLERGHEYLRLNDLEVSRKCMGIVHNAAIGSLDDFFGHDEKTIVCLV